MRVLFLAIGCLALGAGAAAWSGERCGPYPRVDIITAQGTCLGLVAGPDGFKWPRSIVQLNGKRFLIADAAGWYQRGEGRILALDLGDDGRAHLETLIAGRNLTDGIALGPDGKVYAGDDDSIWRFDPSKGEGSIEILKRGLPGKQSPGDHLHPLKRLLFDADNNLVVNFGAPTDACERVPGKNAMFPMPCPSVEGNSPDAALWKLTFDWPGGGAPKDFTPVARGLRNSMALALHAPSGHVLQAENNIDAWPRHLDPNLPPDEFNLIAADKHYGWPYCAGGLVAPGYSGRVKSCAAFETPVALIPAHSAPLAMLYYSGEMFPELQGKLLVAFHGTERYGQSLVAYDVDAGGIPQAPKTFSPKLRWRRTLLVDGGGKYAAFRPSGMIAARDGSLMFVDDKDRTITVLLKSGDAKSAPVTPREETVNAPPPPKGWDALFASVLKPRCAACHNVFDKREALAAWTGLIAGEQGLRLDSNHIADAGIFQAIDGKGSYQPMPKAPAKPLTASERSEVQKFLSSLH